MTLTTVFFDVMLFCIKIGMSFLPVIVIPDHAIEIFIWFIQYISPGAYLFDMLSFFQCISILITVFLAKFLMMVWNWFMSYIPFLKIGKR